MKTMIFIYVAFDFMIFFNETNKTLRGFGVIVVIGVFGHPHLGFISEKRSAFEMTLGPKAGVKKP